MEEKDYKKLYEDVVALAKDGLKDGLYLSQSAKAVTEFLFPQLKETEDEKVKRELTKFLINYNNGVCTKPSEDKIDSWIKWIDKKASDIEKQGEQKAVDEVKPKFKVGDWIVYSRNDSSMEILYVYDIRDGRYYFNDNIHFSWSIKECEEKSHFWTIQDAKDGDVLADCFGNICIYQKPSTNTYYHTHCYGNHKYFIDDGGSHEVAGTYPATKEQRDLLFQKMKEAGYEWNDEKKELKKIEQTSSWREEDEKMLSQVINEIEAIKSNSSTIFEKNIAQDKIDWLQSLKEKIQPNKE